MSALIDNSITIYEALEHIKDGKYVMPAFQRDDRKLPKCCKV